MTGWLRSLLPGVFAEVHHWRERAEKAEARLGEVVNQFATTLAHENEQHDAERRELIAMLAGNTSQKPPQPAEEEGVFSGTPSFTQPTHPIQRKRLEFEKEHANVIPDDVVDMAVEEYQRMKAQGFDPFDAIH